jgi:hypothetical protein
MPLGRKITRAMKITPITSGQNSKKMLRRSARPCQMAASVLVVDSRACGSLLERARGRR